MAQKEKPMAMKERLLVEATRLFARHGFEGTSLQVIADAVGIQKASLLYHYSSKQALREAVLDGLLEHWKDTLPKALMAATSGENRIDSLMAEVFVFFREDRDRARLLMREILDAPELMQERVTIHLTPWVRLLTDGIRLGQREGRIQALVDPEAYIAALCISIVGSFAAGEVAGGLLGVSESPVERGVMELLRMAKSSLLVQGACAPSSEQEHPAEKQQE